jgi:hypothetical protein
LCLHELTLNPKKFSESLGLAQLAHAFDKSGDVFSV